MPHDEPTGFAPSRDQQDHSPPPDACPSATVVSHFVEGALPPDRKTALLAHIDGCEDCRKLLSALSGTVSSTPLEQGPARASQPPSGAEAFGDRYELLDVLGAGGMGLVVQARHRALGQSVALKLLKPELAANREAIGRFFQEARAAAALQSEHIVRVLDAGHLSDGQCFIAMELLEGEDLSAHLQRTGPLSPARAVSLLLQASLGLALAHRRGIVHRDIKPANLFVARSPDGQEVVKVLDFGVAKVTEGDAGFDTSQSSLLGSPRYMAPEQLRASASVDARADVWALGAVLYETLAGASAFRGDTIAEVMSAVLTESPLPLEGLRPDLPKGLDAVVHAALTKDPDARWPTMAAFAEALAPFADEDGRRILPRVFRALGLAPPESLRSPSQPPSEPAPPPDPSPVHAPASPARPASREGSWERAAKPWPWLALGGLATVAVAAAFLIDPSPTPNDRREPTGTAPTSTPTLEVVPGEEMLADPPQTHDSSQGPDGSQAPDLDGAASAGDEDLSPDTAKPPPASAAPPIPTTSPPPQQKKVDAPGSPLDILNQDGLLDRD